MKAIKKHRALGALACSARLRKLHFGINLWRSLKYRL